jgi:L-iditol 2-dehydrogenase
MGAAYDTPVRAVVLDAYGQPQLAEIQTPEPSLEVLACGLCGSDVEKIGRAPAGTVLGHEVVARGAEGRLALLHHRPCGRCARCRSGHESTCAEFGAATIVPGGLAERVQECAGFPLPAHVDDVRGTMVEPLACVLRGAARVPHGRVLVVGNGFVGRLFRAVLERRGEEVFALDADPRRAGCEPDGPVDAAVVCARGGGGDALRAVEPGGTVLVFAGAGPLAADLVYRRELTVVGCRSATPETMLEAMQLLPQLELPEPTVLPLEQFADGLASFQQRDSLKIVFIP